MTVAGVPACWGQASIGPAGRATPHGHQGSELGSQSSPPLLCALVSPSVNGAGPTSQRRQTKRGLRTSDWPGWGTWGPGDTVGGFPGPQGSPGLESGPHWEHFSIKEAFCTVSHGLPHPHQELTGPLIKICLSRLKLQRLVLNVELGLLSGWLCTCVCAQVHVRVRVRACMCVHVRGCVRACRCTRVRARVCERCPGCWPRLPWDFEAVVGTTGSPLCPAPGACCGWWQRPQGLQVVGEVPRLAAAQPPPQARLRPPPPSRPHLGLPGPGHRVAE